MACQDLLFIALLSLLSLLRPIVSEDGSNSIIQQSSTGRSNRTESIVDGQRNDVILSSLMQMRKKMTQN